MKFYLADVAAGSELVAASIGVILFMLMCVLTEAVVIRLLKTVLTFGKAFLYSTIVNVVTMVIGFLFVPAFENKFHNLSEIYRLLIYFFLSVIIEGIGLKWLIKNSTLGQVFITSFLMNFVSYGIMYALLKLTSLSA